MIQDSVSRTSAQSTGLHLESRYSIPQLMEDTPDSSHTAGKQGPRLLDLTGQIFGTINDHVAAGSFGNVYRCDWRQPTGPQVKVAVKIFKSNTSEQDLRRLRREARIWARLRHENIVSLLGTTKDFGRCQALVSLWFPHGTLHRLIGDKGARLSIKSKLNLLHDIASGLHYLHGIPIVHGDITSTNVLIDIKEGEYKACLTDFGLSTVLGGLLDDHTVEGSTVRHGAIKWTAPELLRMAHDNATNIKPTEQNDMYSFGRVMFHVLTLLLPWGGCEDYQVLRKILEGQEIVRSDIPHAILDVTDTRWNEIELCWSVNPSARPSASMAMAFLKSELNALTNDNAFVGKGSRSSLLTPVHPPSHPDSPRTQIPSATVSSLSLSGPLNVLIFGETGVGKSSVINLIMGAEVARTSPDAPTCTLEHTPYERTLGDQHFKLWEVSSIAPMGFFRRLFVKWRLKKTFNRLYRDDGVYLLLYCMRKPRVQGTLVKDFKIFTSIVGSTAGRVPVAAVVTGLEDYPSDMDDWWEKNEQMLKDQGMKFSKHACITSLPDDPASTFLRTRRRRSEQTIRSLICEFYQAGRTSDSVIQAPIS